MGKIIPEDVAGHYAEWPAKRKNVATDDLTQEFGETIEEADVDSDDRFQLTYTADGYPPSLTEK